MDSYIDLLYISLQNNEGRVGDLSMLDFKSTEMNQNTETLSNHHQNTAQENVQQRSHTDQQNRSEVINEAARPSNHGETSTIHEQKTLTPVIRSFKSQKGQVLTYELDRLKFEFKLRKYSLKITVYEAEKPQGLQDLLVSKDQSSHQSFSVVLTKDNFSASMRKYIRSVSKLFLFLQENLQDNSRVSLEKGNIRLSLPFNDDLIPFRINLQALCESRYKWQAGNLDNMEEKLLQFSNQDMDMIENAFLLQENQDNFTELSQRQKMRQWLQYGKQSDQEEFLQVWTNQLSDIDQPNTALPQIEDKEREIEEFQKRFPLFKRQPTSYPEQNTTSYRPPPSNNDRMTINSTNTANHSVFPPGYVPPHLAKPTANDGLTSDTHLRFQANQTKKEKLKMAKQMLKMGHSTAQVIQRLQALERQSKTGTTFIDPNPHPKMASRAPSVQSASQQQQPQPSPNNERAVREMLISLIRAKTYKKLDDIQKHMANQGLQTTTAALKRIVDEIKAKNAQRKGQNNQNQPNE